MEETVVSDDGDKRTKMAGLGFLAGLGLVVGGVAYLEFRARRVNSADDVAEGLQIKLMGILPILPRRLRAGSRRTRRNDRYWHNLMLESMDTTRLALVHTARRESLRILMITSAFGGEGKTMLSSHLAMNLARSRLRTLLIDADLRRPAVHRVFER